MNASHATFEIENQQIKFMFKKLFLIGNKLEELNDKKLDKNVEINEIIGTIDEIMETMIRIYEVSY